MNSTLKAKFYGVLLLFLISGYIFTCNVLNIFGNNFVKKLPFPKINLGLDLIGGLHLSLEPDLDTYMKEKYESIAKEFARFNDFKVKSVSKDGIVFEDSDNLNFKELDSVDKKLVIDRKAQLVKYDDEAIKAIQDEVIANGISIIRNRIDALGTREINIYRASSDTVVLQIPNETSSDEVKTLVSSSAKLTFHLVNQMMPYTDNPKNVFDNKYIVLPLENQKGEKPIYQVVTKEPSVLGSDVSDARISFDNISPTVAIGFNSKGAKDFAKVTSLNVGSSLAIVLDGKVISAPRINEPIMSGNASISGKFTSQELKNLAISLKSGSLPTKFSIIEEKLIDASLGAKSIKTSAISMAAGFLMILIFMIIFYKKLGIIALFGLLTNTFLTVSVFSIFGITITLASMAGLLLTIAMAVDANVLIYEKMKEFDKKAFTQFSLINSGFNGAMSAIVDSNVTTIIAASMLLFFGTVFVKGFAVSLIIGIVLSFFTAVSLTKILAQYLVSHKKYTLI